MNDQELWYMFCVGGRWFIGKTANNLTGHVTFSQVREVLSGWEQVVDPHTKQPALRSIFTIVTIPPFTEPQQMTIWNPTIICLGADEELTEEFKKALSACLMTEESQKRRHSPSTLIV